MTSQLKAYSLLTGDVLDLGPADTDLDDMLELGDTMATSRPGLVVFVDGPELQKWETT